MNSKKKRIIIGILLGAVLLIGGIAAFSFFQFQAALSAKKDPTEIEVELGDIVVEVTDSGTVEAVRSVDVRSRASGRLQTLYVAEGERVAANQEVALIDPEEPRLRYEQDRAQLDGASESAKRSALEVEQRRRSTRAALDEARARVRQIELELAAQPKLSSAEIRSAEAKSHRLRQSDGGLWSPSFRPPESAQRTRFARPKPT
jgi:HlyD family secretion protein